MRVTWSHTHKTSFELRLFVNCVCSSWQSVMGKFLTSRSVCGDDDDRGNILSCNHVSTRQQEAEWDESQSHRSHSNYHRSMMAVELQNYFQVWLQILKSRERLNKLSALYAKRMIICIHIKCNSISRSTFLVLLFPFHVLFYVFLFYSISEIYRYRRKIFVSEQNLLSLIWLEEIWNLIKKCLSKNNI